MNETVQNGATPKLNAALAKVQAEYPKVVADQKADIPGKEGKRGYSYNYSDLGNMSAVVLPLLGKNGLAFTSRPTVVEGHFVLLYELRHESGEQIDGIWPLPASAEPQAMGGKITYYKRYALSAVTGIAPVGEDNDAQTANQEQRFDGYASAGAAFDNAAPAPARQQGNGHRTERLRSTPPDDEFYATPPEGDGALGDLTVQASGFATEDDGRTLWREVSAKAKAREISREDAKHLQDIITARIADLKAPAEGTAADLDPGDEWAVKADDILTYEDAVAAAADVRKGMQSGSIAQERGEAILARIDSRLQSLSGAAA